MRKIFYRCTMHLAAMYMVCLLGLAYELVISEVPDEIYVEEGQEAELHMDFPFVVESIETESGEEKKLCSMFGVIPVKEVTVSVVDEQKIYPIGEIVGLYTECAGIFVIDTCEIETMDGEIVNPTGNQLQTGDYILAINGERLDNKEEMVDCIKKSKGETIEVRYVRNEREDVCQMTPVLSKTGEYLLGIWVKDDLAGVGTLTYVTTEGEFGALGHGMGNGENQDLLQITGGDIYVSNLIGIQKGEKGVPGEVKGVIYYGKTNHKGEVEVNIKTGVFGVLDEEDCKQYYSEIEVYDVGHKQDIEVGDAQIISDISGKRQTYDIRISYVDYLSVDSNKGLHIEVTDPELLDLTGGIVQGMSGSPILQNGKVIGAVTHVLINDPTSGYGIFIEDMLGNN